MKERSSIKVEINHAGFPIHLVGVPGGHISVDQAGVLMDRAAQQLAYQLSSTGDKGQGHQRRSQSQPKGPYAS